MEFSFPVGGEKQIQGFLVEESGTKITENYGKFRTDQKLRDLSLLFLLFWLKILVLQYFKTQK